MIKRFLKKNTYIFYSLKIVRRKFLLFFYNRMSLNDIARANKKKYKAHLDEILDWNNLQSYTEKMQYEKIFNLYPLKSKLTDKYEVRNWIQSKIGDEYLIKLLKVWDDVNEINFSELPAQFVLKTNCSSGDVIIVKKKSELTKKDIRNIKVKLKYHLNEQFGYNTYELHYFDINPKIIAEEYIKSEESDLRDYKFLCFNGKPKYCWVDIGRYHNHKRNVYNLDWELQDWNQGKYDNYMGKVSKPSNFNKMIEIAEVLSKGFKHVRVDLYNNNGKIFFGEMTFTNGSGFEKITPHEANLKLGQKWELENSRDNKNIYIKD